MNRGPCAWVGAFICVLFIKRTELLPFYANQSFTPSENNAQSLPKVSIVILFPFHSYPSTVFPLGLRAKGVSIGYIERHHFRLKNLSFMSCFLTQGLE
jgi:hypothetical protein